MLPTPTPLRPARGDLAWLFGPSVATLLVVGGVYLAGGSSAVQHYVRWVAGLLIALTWVGGFRQPRPKGAPAPAALTATRLRGRPAIAAPLAYRVVAPRLGPLLAFSVLVFQVDVVPTVILMAVALISVTRVARGVPTIALTPDGIARGYPVPRALAWERIESVTLRGPERWPELTIRATGRRRPWARPEWTTGVDLVYLAGVIRYYVDHSERRAAIGTAGEQERVYELLSTNSAMSVHDGSSANAG